MHQQVDGPREVLVITDDTTRAEIEEAMRHVRHTLDRCPSHWAERRAGLHAKLDSLLTDWERASDGRAQVPHP
jgi:hypothetical protein